MNSKIVLVSAVLVVAAGAAGFFGGVKYEEGKASTLRQGFMGQGNRRQNGQLQAGGRQGVPVSGEIIGRDDKSITVKLQDGTSRIVMFVDNTPINKASEGVKEDLKVGERVTVFGTENSDKSVTAQSIQLGDRLGGTGQGFRGMMGLPGASGIPEPTTPSAK